MPTPSKDQIDDMRRIILIAENREPLLSKVKRRSITLYDQHQEWRKQTATGLGMLYWNLRHIMLRG